MIPTKVEKTTRIPKIKIAAMYLLLKRFLKFFINRGIQAAKSSKSKIILKVNGPNSIRRPAPKIQRSAANIFNKINAIFSNLLFDKI